MIKTELKLYYTSSVPLNNNAFQYYTENWASPITGISETIYPSLSDTGLTSITILSGWTWKNSYLLSDYGSTDEVYQSALSGYTFDRPEENFTLKFVIKGVDDSGSTYGITPYIFGISGDTVYTDGYYEQYFTINSGSTIDDNIKFVPQSGFTGGLSAISITPTTVKTETLDLFEDESINLTFQLNTSVANRGASYSKTIQIPGTSVNNKAFMNILDIGYYIDLASISNDNVIFLNKKIAAGIYRDSIELLYGYFELNKIKNKDGLITYEGVFYSNNKSIAEALGDLGIKNNEDSADDIDFSGYDHLFNWTNIRNSWPASYWSNLPTWNPTTYYIQGTRVLYNSLLYLCLNSNNIPTPPPNNPTYWLSTNNYANSTGYYYPVINFSGYKEGNDIRLENFKPCIYVKELFDRILNNAGFTYTSTFLNSNVFKDLVIPVSNVLQEFALTNENSKFMVGKTGVQNLKELGNMQTSTPQFVTFNKTSGTLPGGTIYFNNNNTWNPSTSKWVVQQNGRFNIVCELKLGIHTEPSDSAEFWGAGPQNYTTYFKTQIWKKQTNNVEVKLVEEQSKWDWGVYPYTQASGWTVTQGSMECKAIAEDVMLYQNEQVFVRIVQENNVDMLTYDGEYWNSVGGIIYGQIYLSDDTNGVIPTHLKNLPVEQSFYYENCMVYMNDALPDMKQIDFIKNIFNKFNLILYEDKTLQNNLIIEPYDTFYSGTTYVDWTSKVDYKEQIEIERIPYLLDKSMEFKFKPDSSDLLLKNYNDKYDKEFGDNYIKNPYYSNGIEKIDDEFSSTMLETFAGTNWIASSIYNLKDETEFTSLPTDTDYNYRMLYRNLLTSSNTNRTLTTINIMAPDPGTTNLRRVGFLSKHPYAGHLDNPFIPTIDLNYGIANYYLQTPLFSTINNIVWVYWQKKLARYLDPNSKMVTYKIRLTPSDIANLDFRNKVYIDNQKFILNKIIEWTPDKACKVELILETPLDSSAYITQDAYIPSYYLEQGKEDFSKIIDIKPAIPLSFTDENNTGYTFADYNNQYPQKSSGIIIGNSNIINGSEFLIQGKRNTISGDNNILINSNDNELNGDDLILLNSKNLIVNSGITKITAIYTSGITIDTNNKVYLKNRDLDDLSDYTYVNTKSGQTITISKNYTDSKTGDTQTWVSNNFYDTAQTDAKYATKGGAFNNTIKTTQTYTSNDDYVIGDNYNGTGRTITLRDTEMVDGKVFIIHDLRGNSATNNINIYPEGIGTPITTISTNNGFKLVYSDGSRWYSN